MNLEQFEDHCWRDIVSEEMLAIYEAYVRELHVGKRPALLAIDLYNCVFPPAPLPVVQALKDYPKTCGEYAWQAIEPLRELFALVRSKGIPVFHTTHANRSKSQTLRSTNRPSSTNKEHDFDFYPDFVPAEGEVVFEKERASAFFGTSLVAHLVRQGIDSVIVCGESTSGCVRAAVVDGYSYGFHMVVVEEGVFDRSLLNHKVNLFDLHHKYADVMHLHELKEHLRKL